MAKECSDMSKPCVGKPMLVFWTGVIMAFIAYFVAMYGVDQFTEQQSRATTVLSVIGGFLIIVGLIAEWVCWVEPN